MFRSCWKLAAEQCGTSGPTGHLACRAVTVFSRLAAALCCPFLSPLLANIGKAGWKPCVHMLGQALIEALLPGHVELRQLIAVHLQPRSVVICLAISQRR